MEQPGKRGRILQAAVEVFSEHGFHAATIDQIAERAGVGKGTVYLYFESKQGLFTAILQEGVALLVRGAAQLAESEADPRKRLHKLVRWHLGVILENVPRMRMFVQQGIPSDLHTLFPEMQRRVKEYQQLYVTAFREGMERGYFRPHDAELLAAATMGCLNQVGKYLAEDAPQASFEQSLQQVLQFIFCGIESGELA